MTKISRKNIDSKDLGNYINNLWAAFTLADSKEDVRLLFKDLFTHTEYKMLAKRFEIARRLINKEKYEDIARIVGVTANTISNVSNVLSGSGFGYRKVVQKINAEEENSFNRKLKKKSVFKKLARRTVLGAVLKAGAVKIDSKILKTLKKKTAIKRLPL